MYMIVHIPICRLESTDIPKDAQDRLAEIVEKLKADPDREKLDVNYLHHSQVVDKRNQTNVTWHAPTESSQIRGRINWFCVHKINRQLFAGFFYVVIIMIIMYLWVCMYNSVRLYDCVDVVGNCYYAMAFQYTIYSGIRYALYKWNHHAVHDCLHKWPESYTSVYIVCYR